MFEMEVMIYFENKVIKPPKQLEEVGGKRKYGYIPVCKNPQYDKQKEKKT